MSRRFDCIVTVDWSARSVPTPARPSPDAIWIGVAEAGRTEAHYFRTRSAAVSWLAARLAAVREGGRRALVGFDFPFGYPSGFAEALTGSPDGLAVWHYLAGRVSDGPDNANNRREVAGEINASLPGIGPFWGNGARDEVAGLSRLKPKPGEQPLPEWRLVERAARGAKSCWQLSGNGSVGGQVLVGLPALERLRRDRALAGAVEVWPFQTGLGVPSAPIVLAEIYPALLAAEVAAAAEPGSVKDEVQVRVIAGAFRALDERGELAPLFGAAPGLSPAERATVAREEAWILGVGHEAALRAAAASRRARIAAPPPLRDDCFALPPGIAWVPVDQALARLRAGLVPVAGTEEVALEAALGRVLAADVASRRDHPPTANSAVDGYGFAHASLGPGPHRLKVAAGRAAAGRPFPGALPPGEALRILTGAALPEGIDTVVLEEDTVRTGDEVAFARAPKRGANTRAAGEDVRAGEGIFAAGRVLQPQDLALAAATGLGRLPVRRPLRVAVLSTGDELRPAGTAAEPHQTFDANRPMLLGLVARWGMEPVDLGQAADREEAVVEALDRGAREADAILTSGGASAGDEDHLSRVLGSRGRLETWRIAIKPGRPLALGFWGGAPVFGLPGNPVAAFVCTLLFARPALLALAGAPWSEPEGYLLPALFTKEKKAGRREYLRARRTSAGVEAFRSEGSGRVSGLVWADGLVELPDEAMRIAPGDLVRYLPFSAFGL